MNPQAQQLIEFLDPGLLALALVIGHIIVSGLVFVFSKTTYIESETNRKITLKAMEDARASKSEANSARLISQANEGKVIDLDCRTHNLAYGMIEAVDEACPGMLDEYRKDKKAEKKKKKSHHD